MTNLTPSGRISKSITKINAKEHRAWGNIKARCYRQDHKDYKNYGGRGIKMDDRWRMSFSVFLNDVGNAPSSEHSIDRFPNNDGNYEPGNCRWATRIEQARNKRNTILITYLCRTRILGEWCQILNLRYGSLYKAIRTNEDKKPSEVFFEFIISRIYREPRIYNYHTPEAKQKKQEELKRKNDRAPRYYHDLQSVLLKHGLSCAKVTPGKP